MSRLTFAAASLAVWLAAPLPVLIGCAENDGAGTEAAGGNLPGTPGDPANPPGGAPEGGGDDPGVGPSEQPAQPDPSDQTAPEVVAVHPAAGATKVFLDAQITARFDAPLDPASITPDSLVVTNFQGRVAGSLAYDGETIVFIPAALLVYNTDHTVTVSGVADVSGNVLAEPYRWTFRTGTCRSTFC